MLSEKRPDWREIVDQHGDRVYRIAFRILGSVHDAEDVAQAVFTEAFEIHAAGTVQSWPGLLIRLATLRAIDQSRRRRATLELNDLDKSSTIEPLDEMIAGEMADWLRRAVGLLPDQQGVIFSLFYFEQLDRHQVAELLGISAETVSTTLSKARQRLMAQFALLHEKN